MLPLGRRATGLSLALALLLAAPAPPAVAAAPAPAPAAASPAADAAADRLERRRAEAETVYREEYYRHLARMNRITADKFVWQDRASDVTLWLVVFIVVSGVAMAAFQLWVAFRKGGIVSETHLEVSAKNFRVTTSVVGIVILIISVAFLYLFLKEVYRLEPLGTAAEGPDAAAAADAGGSGGGLSPADFGLPPPDGDDNVAAAGPAEPPADAQAPRP